MLKLFVTGDNHIGLSYASHEQAGLLAQARLNAFHTMVETANREGCRLFVITGDLFENTYGIPKRTIKALLDILSNFRGTVALLPGNHDYYDPETKLWQELRQEAAGRSNLLLLTEYRPYSLTVGEETAVLYPALCTSLHSALGENNLGWLKTAVIPQDRVYRIGLAHGAVEGKTIDREGSYFLMTQAELLQIPVDVWLLGHTHVPFPGELKTDWEPSKERIFNPGTHVQTDVNCNTEGCCFILELSPDKTLRARKVITGTLRFYRKRLSLTAGHMEEALAQALAPLPDQSVVELLLSGAVTSQEYDGREAFLKAALDRFLEGAYDDHALSRLVSKEIIQAEFPETSLSARWLTALLEEPKEAQLAYELLVSLKEET